jgi:HlyD family secretion protein
MATLWRMLLVLLSAGALTGLLIYAQLRTEPPRASGFIEADAIRLGSRVGGRIQEVLVEEGQAIEPGAVLVRLEEYDLGEREAQARAELAAREAEYRRLAAGYRLEEKAQAAARVERLQQKLNALLAGPRPEEIEAARARVRLAQAQQDLARNTYERYASLYDREKGVVTRESLDRSIEELRAAQANKDMRDQELLLLEHGTRAEDIAAARAELAEADAARRLMENGFRPEDIEQARAAADAAQAALGALHAMREELTIRSPVAGVVEAQELRPGDLVAPNAPVLSVIDTGRMWVRTYISESRLDVELGQQVRVTVSSFPGQEFPGVIKFISRQAEFMPRNVQTPEERSKQVFRIKVEVPSDRGLRPGMSADVWLENRDGRP